MAIITIFSDFGAQENKVCHCFHFSFWEVQIDIQIQYNPEQSLKGCFVYVDRLMLSFIWIAKTTLKKVYKVGGLILPNFKPEYAAAAAKLLQSCPTLCNPMDCSLLGFSVHGILQARTLEWVAISFSNAWKWKVKSLSCVWLLATPWTAAYQAPPSMGFSRQEYWSGVPLSSP